MQLWLLCCPPILVTFFGGCGKLVVLPEFTLVSAALMSPSGMFLSCENWAEGSVYARGTWEKVPREQWSEGVVGGVKILIGRKVRIRAGNCSTAHDWRNGPCARGRCQKAAKSCQSEHHAILKVIPTKKKSCPAKKWWQLKVHAPTGVRGAGGQLGKREISWKCGELLLLRVWRLTITDRGHVGSWWHWLTTVFLLLPTPLLWDRLLV